MHAICILVLVLRESIMKRAVWVHQFSQLGEHTVEDIAATLLPRGITAVYVKAMDGDQWMGDFYSHPMAPSSTQQFNGLTDDFADAGLELVPWVVPRWTSSEATAHELPAGAGGKLIIDWEYQYKGFWSGSDVQAAAYFRNLRSMVASGTWVAVAPDPRQVGRDYDRSLIAGLSAYQPQTYWTDFQQDALVVLNAARVAMGTLDPFEPILPYNSTAADMEAAINWCFGQGCQAISMWRMGSANADQLDSFAAPDPGEVPSQPNPEPEPQPQCDWGWQDKKNSVVGAAGELQTVGDQLRAEAGRKGGPRKTVITKLAGDVGSRAAEILA